MFNVVKVVHFNYTVHIKSQPGLRVEHQMKSPQGLCGCLQTSCLIVCVVAKRCMQKGTKRCEIKIRGRVDESSLFCNRYPIAPKIKSGS